MLKTNIIGKKHFAIAPVLKLDITSWDINEIMTTALDAIQGWCYKVEIETTYLGDCEAEQIALGGTLCLYVKDDEIVHQLDLQKFLTGLRLWIEKSQNFELEIPGRLDVWEIGFASADQIIQYALFNRIVYK